MNNDDLNDFGFNFIDDELEEQLTKSNTKAKELYALMEPFLDNLAKNPEKKTIHWPNRAEKIEQFKKKLKDILEG